jgi:predicted nuclease of predicted toxin-antitoxin system
VRILANENIPQSAVLSLRRRGHDVLSVKETMRGESDDRILARAQAEGRLVLTQDKGFGELAFRSHLPAACGIVLFRLNSADPAELSERMVQVLSEERAWAGHFSVVLGSGIRMRPMP